MKKLNAKAQIAELNDAKTCVQSGDLPCAVVLVFDVAFVMNIRLHLCAAPARMARDPKLPKPSLLPALACTLFCAPHALILILYRTTPCACSATRSWFQKMLRICAR